MNARSVILLAVFILGVLGARADADSITLRTGATVRAGGSVTIGDVALLVGDGALAHAGVVVRTDALQAAGGRAWLEVTLGDIREALRDAGVKLGPVALSGSRCVVRLIDAPLGTPERIEAEEPETPCAEVVEASGPPTVRLRIAQALARLYGVELVDMRLRFDDADRAFLDQLEHGRRIVVVTGTSAGSARQVVSVRVFAGEAITEARSVTVSIEVRREVLVVAGDIPRRSHVSADSIRVERMWVEAGGAALITDPADAVGGVARSDLTTGTVLRANQLDAAVLVERGELVRVHCLSGGIAMTMQARARQAGKKGDVIEVRREGADRSFMARVDAAGSVVIDLDGAPLAGE